MRAKHVMNRLHVGERLRIVVRLFLLVVCTTCTTKATLRAVPQYERIALTRFTKAFIFVAVAHCLVQIALQSVAFSFNRSASKTVTDIIEGSRMRRQFSFVSNDQLFVCSGTPENGDMFDSVCWAIAGTGVPIGNTTQTQDDAERQNARGDDEDKDDRRRQPDRRDKHDARSVGESLTPRIGTRDISAVPIFDAGEVVGVTVTGLNGQQSTELSGRCIQALNWPGIVLHDAQREDISFLCYQVWLLGISLVTILNESIPHLVAALITHGMSTAWSAFQLSRTGRYENQYSSLIVNDSCDGVDVIPGFWNRRMTFFIPILVLNVIVLLVSLGLSLKLFSIYARQTFNRVGACKKMNLLYSYVLLFSVFLQLSAFFTICGSALWIDALSNGVLRGSTAYRVVFTIACVVEFPWVIMGWMSIRREHHVYSLVFLIIGLALCAAWISMFANVLYRWSFQNFPFFATLTITAFIVLVATVVLAVVCRVNFGKGLPQYLRTEEHFDDSSFIPVVVSNKRRSNNTVSVYFPDKRISALKRARGSDEKPPLYSVNTYDRGERRQRPPSEGSIIDIKPPSLHRNNTSSDSASVPSATADDGHGNKRGSLLSRIRDPFFRLSDNSRFGSGKMSLRFSAFTSNSTSADLERDAPDVPEVPVPMPRVPPASYKPQAKRSKSLNETAEPPKRESALMRSLSVSTRAADLPAINIIPASVPQSNILAVQGDLSARAASESRDSYGVGRSMSSRSGSTRSGSFSLRGSPPRAGLAGLPSNPRANRG